MHYLSERRAGTFFKQGFSVLESTSKLLKNLDIGGNSAAQKLEDTPMNVSLPLSLLEKEQKRREKSQNHVHVSWSPTATIRVGWLFAIKAKKRKADFTNKPRWKKYWFRLEVLSSSSLAL